MSEGFVADLRAETGDKDRWRKINRDRGAGMTRQKNNRTQKETAKDGKALSITDGGCT